MGRLIRLLVQGHVFCPMPTGMEALLRCGLASPGFPSGITPFLLPPPCQAELIEHRLHSKEEPEQPTAGKKNWVPVRPSRRAWHRFLRGRPSHAKRPRWEEVRESYLRKCCCCLSGCLGFSPPAVSRSPENTRDGDRLLICGRLACREKLLGRPTETLARAAPPPQGGSCGLLLP